MSSTVEELASQLDDVVEQLLAADFALAGGESVLALWKTIETARRRLDVVEFHVIHRAVELNLAFDHGCANLAVFARQFLRITPARARVRVQNAASFGPRRDLQGEALSPVFAICADALRSAAITAVAARAIQREIEKLPHEITADMGEALEGFMVDYARNVDSGEAAKYAEALRYSLDQDGRWKDLDTAHARRAVTVRRRPDGSATYTVEATTDIAEVIDTVLDTYAKPQPAGEENGKPTPDPRTPGQRRHDGLLDALRALLSSGCVPDNAGCRTTVILRGSVTDFVTNTGTMTTGHGYAVPTTYAKTWLEPEARAILVMLSDTNRIEAHSSSQRLFTEQQRLVMHARDLGCTLPDCDRPAAWTQAHHVIDWATSNHTRVDEGTLLCGEDHRSFHALGWTNTIIDGTPVWTPPRWIDPTQTPRTNTRHQPPPLPVAQLRRR